MLDEPSNEFREKGRVYPTSVPSRIRNHPTTTGTNGTRPTRGCNPAPPRSATDLRGMARETKQNLQIAQEAQASSPEEPLALEVVATIGAIARASWNGTVFDRRCLQRPGCGSFSYRDEHKYERRIRGWILIRILFIQFLSRGEGGKSSKDTPATRPGGHLGGHGEGQIVFMKLMCDVIEQLGFGSGWCNTFPCL